MAAHIMTGSADLSVASQRIHSATVSSAAVDAARRRLEALSFPQLRKIVCEYYEGVLTLRGKLNSFYLRQIAFSAVKNVAGVEEVADRLEVVQPRIGWE
jgi:osmotically-inducible protein OsmY